MNYYLQIAVMLEIYIILALSLNLINGTTGLLSMAQGAMYAAGAFTTAVLNTKYGFNFFATLPFSIASGIMFSFIIGIFAYRLRDLYFSLATLGFQVIVFTIFYNSSYFGGSDGISGVDKPILFGFKFSSLPSYFYLTTFFTVLAILFFYLLSKSPMQRAMESVRDDDLQLRSLGKNPAYFKFVALATASIFSSIAGSLYAGSITTVDAGSFTIDESILILAICILGGTGTILGSISGAVFYSILPEVLRFVDLPKSEAANLRLMIFALVLIIVVRFKPKGLFGKYEA